MAELIARTSAKPRPASQRTVAQTWLDLWRGATIVLGHYHSERIKRPDGSMRRRKRFVVVGSGLLADVETRQGRQRWLLTAKHIVSSPRERWKPIGLRLLLPGEAGPRVGATAGLRVPLLRRGRPQWFAHPNRHVDLACVPLSKRAGPKTVPRLSPDRLQMQAAMAVGMPIMLLGYPEIGRGTYVQALVRQGLVSWVSMKRARSSPLLIDSHVFPGNSGGPVLALPHGFEGPTAIADGETIRFVGLATQSRILELPMIAGGKEVEIHVKGRKPSQALLAPQFVGIGLVEPALRVGQLLVAAGRWAQRRRRTR